MNEKLRSITCSFCLTQTYTQAYTSGAVLDLPIGWRLLKDATIIEGYHKYRITCPECYKNDRRPFPAGGVCSSCGKGILQPLDEEPFCTWCCTYYNYPSRKEDKQ